MKDEKYEIFLPLNDLTSELEPYEEFFLEQLEKNKEVRHIGLTGVYGSGKSSILESLIKKDDFEPLTEQNVIRIKYKQHFSDEINYDVEGVLKNIIIELMYQVKNDGKSMILKNLSFDNLENTSKVNQRIAISIPIFLTLLYITNLLVKGVKNTALMVYLLYIPLAFLGYLIILTLLESLSATITKIKLAKIEVTLNDNDNISKHRVDKLNIYIEQLIYLLDLQYNEKKRVIIIEDLDRVASLESFEVLKSVIDSLDGKYKAIYVISENLFSQTDKLTKFVDANIEVKPIITNKTLAHNFYEIMQKSDYVFVDNLYSEIIGILEKNSVINNLREVKFLVNKVIQIQTEKTVESEVIFYAVLTFINAKYSNRKSLSFELYQQFDCKILTEYKYNKWFEPFVDETIEKILRISELNGSFIFSPSDKKANKDLFIYLYKHSNQMETDKIRELLGYEYTKLFIKADKMSKMIWSLKPDYSKVEKLKLAGKFTKNLLEKELKTDKTKFWDILLDYSINVDDYYLLTIFSESSSFDFLKIVNKIFNECTYNKDSFLMVKKIIEETKLLDYSNLVSENLFDITRLDRLDNEVIPRILLNAQIEKTDIKYVIENNLYLFNNYLVTLYYREKNINFDNEYLANNLKTLVKYTHSPLAVDKSFEGYINLHNYTNDEELAKEIIEWFDRNFSDKYVLVIKAWTPIKLDKYLNEFDGCNGNYTEYYYTSGKLEKESSMSDFGMFSSMTYPFAFDKLKFNIYYKNRKKILDQEYKWINI